MSEAYSCIEIWSTLTAQAKVDQRLKVKPLLVFSPHDWTLHVTSIYADLGKLNPQLISIPILLNFCESKLTFTPTHEFHLTNSAKFILQTMLSHTLNKSVHNQIELLYQVITPKLKSLTTSVFFLFETIQNFSKVFLI